MAFWSAESAGSHPPAQQEMARKNEARERCRSVGESVNAKGDVGGTTEAVQRLIFQYYDDVRDQAESSFRSARRVAILGFWLLVLTVVYVIGIDFASHVTTAWRPGSGEMNVGAIGLISGTVVEAIAGTQFFLYSRATRQFGAFHICLERTHRYLLSYKMAEAIGKDKDETLEKIVCIMANAPMITRADIEGVESGRVISSRGTEGTQLVLTTRKAESAAHPGD